MVKPEVDALMRNYAGDVPGAAVLVLRNGQPVVRSSYGLADLETGTPATPETNYRLASVTKAQFYCREHLAAGRGDGRLKLDDRGPKVAASPGRRDGHDSPPANTHFGAHRLRRCGPGNLFGAQLHDADVLRLLETQDRTYFRPGTGYRYSNSGYAILLALIVQRGVGEDLRDVPA